MAKWLKFVHSTSLAQGSQVWILGVNLHTAHQAMMWWHHTYKTEEDGIDVNLGTIYLKQKEANGQQMLVQGQSSSPKKKKNVTFLGDAFSNHTI